MTACILAQCKQLISLISENPQSRVNQCQEILYATSTSASSGWGTQGLRERGSSAFCQIEYGYTEHQCLTVGDGQVSSGSVWEACLHRRIPCAMDTTNERQHFVSCNPTFLKPITLQPFCFMFLWSCDQCKNMGSLNIHHGLFMWAANKTSDLQLCFPLGWLGGLGCVTAYILAQCKHLIRLISENPMWSKCQEILYAT